MIPTRCAAGWPRRRPGVGVAKRQDGAPCALPPANRPPRTLSSSHASPSRVPPSRSPFKNSEKTIDSRLLRPRSSRGIRFYLAIPSAKPAPTSRLTPSFIAARISEPCRLQLPTRATNHRHRQFPPKRPVEWVVMSKQRPFCNPFQGRLVLFIRTGGSRCAATPGYNLAIPSGWLVCEINLAEISAANRNPILKMIGNRVTVLEPAKFV